MSESSTVIRAVIVSTFFVGFGGGVIFPILPNLSTVLGISPSFVGLILSANRLTRIVTNAPAGSLVDRVGARRPFVAGLFIEGVATLGYLGGLGATLPEIWFLGARILWGVGSAMVFATAYTIAADVSTDRSRGKSMGVVRGGITLGFPSGLFLGGIISDFYSIATAFIVAATFALAASGVAYLIVPETHVAEQKTAIRPWDLDRTLQTITVGVVNFGLFFVYLGTLFSTLVLFVDVKGISVLGYGPQGMSGLLMALTVIAASGFMFGGGKVSDIQGTRTPVLLVFLGMSFIGFVLLAMADTLVGLVVASLIIGAGQGGTSGPLIALLADLTPEQRMGRAMGTNNVLGDLGGGLGPIVSLPLVESIGFTKLYAACAIVPLAAGGVLLGGLYVNTGSIHPQRELSTDE